MVFVSRAEIAVLIWILHLNKNQHVPGTKYQDFISFRRDITI